MHHAFGEMLGSPYPVAIADLTSLQKVIQKWIASASWPQFHFAVGGSRSLARALSIGG